MNIKGSELLHRLERFRAPSLLFLLTLRIIDATQTAIGLRLGIPETNSMIVKQGISFLLILNTLLILTLILMLYISTLPIFSHTKAKHIFDIVLTIFIAYSLYTVFWNNPQAIAP